LFLVLTKAAYVLMKKNNEEFYFKCAACTVFANRTLKQVSDLHVPVAVNTAQQVQDLQIPANGMRTRLQLGPVS
jgi:hypothetical protein